MTKSDKTTVIDELSQKFTDNSFFYLADSSTLSVIQVNEFRRKCFESGVEMQVVKNTLAKKAMEKAGGESTYSALFDVLKGPTAILFSETANTPARVIEEFRKKNEMPILKAAYIDSDTYIGDDQLSALAALKSKEELVGDIIALLQSPIKTVVSAVQSGGSTLSGLLKALEQRG